MRRAGKSPEAKPAWSRSAWRIVLLAAALIGITFVTFSGVLRNESLDIDDQVYVFANPHVLAGLKPESVAWAFTTTDRCNWHPITWLSHMLDVELYGLDAGRHHLTNLVLHAANAVLLFLLLVGMTGALWRPAFVAALFAVHPLHVESVAWIAERKDVLSTLFGLLTLAAWLGFVRSKTAGRYALVLALFALALMAKPMLTSLPFVMLLLDYWPLGRTARVPIWKEKLPLFAMSAASCVVTLAVGAIVPFSILRIAVRAANAAASYVRYLAKAIWPSDLSFFYPYPYAGVPAWEVAGAVVALGVVTAACVRYRERAPYLVVGWLWYLVTLVPVIGLVQVGSQAMADRYTYVPLIGIFVAIAWGLAELTSRYAAARSVAAAGAAASLVALVILTRREVGYWRDTESLYTHALAVTTDNWFVHKTFGRWLFESWQMAIIRERGGRTSWDLRKHGNPDDAIGRLPEAIEHLRLALRLQPRDATAHNTMGLMLEVTGRPAEALEHFTEAVRLKPGNAQARANLFRVASTCGAPGLRGSSYCGPTTRNDSWRWNGESSRQGASQDTPGSTIGTPARRRDP